MFIDRERELAELRQLVERRRPAIALLYGRRRVGKTFLLEHAWEGRRVFYFLVADITAALNRAELLRELERWTGRPYPASDYPTWRTIVRAFVALAESEPLVVVLDEFQYLMGDADDIVSQFVAVSGIARCRDDRCWWRSVAPKSARWSAYVYIATAGLTPAFIALAAEQPQLRLLNLADLSPTLPAG